MCIFRFQDPVLARAFYHEVFGLELPHDDRRGDLHEITIASSATVDQSGRKITTQVPAERPLSGAVITR